MVNFEAELAKLLSLETESLPQYEFAELAAAGQELLAELNKKQTDTSLQIEEIYDLVKEQGFLREKADAEKARADQLVVAAVGLSDLLEDFYAYAGRSGNAELGRQARLLWEKAGATLSNCGIFRFGEEGQSLDPRIHAVKASAASPFPREQVAELLQSGYVYQNVVIRKAAVVVSSGQEEESRKTETAEEEIGLDYRNGANTEIRNEDQYEGDANEQNSRY
ncbi:MAG: nucleotide exchange factor GrpE [Treponema sp.]|jgi:molecular chaperone GrpE (heat shock protein)|nr:nucleotide exchange factor GrpE [Treponema sp.]